MAELIGDFDVIIAGTEEIDKKVFDKAKNLKFISRDGIGLDSVDLNYAREEGIRVSYTPDAPAPAVAELTNGSGSGWISFLTSFTKHSNTCSVRITTIILFLY